MKPKQVAGLIIAKRQSDGAPKEEHSEDNPDAGLEAVAEDLIRATHAKDIRAVASALRAAWELMEENEEPSEQASPHTFEAQNIKAAKEQR